MEQYIQMSILFYLCMNIFIQYHALSRCNYHSKDFSNFYVWIWRTTIIVLNIIGVFFYWFFNRKTLNKYLTDIEEKNIGIVDHNIIFVSLVIAYELLSIPILIQNSENPWIGILLGLTLMLLIINHFRNQRGSNVLFYVVPFIQIASIVAVDLMATSTDLKIIILIVVSSIVHEFPIRFTRVFAVFPLISYHMLSLMRLLKLPDITSMDIAIFLIKNSITYILVIFTFYVLRKQLILNNQLKIMTKTVKENNKKIEEMRIVQERNRIAREIHDTLGHTLTGAIVQLEVAKKYLGKDEEKTLHAINQTQNITREGFIDVKRAIQALRPVMIEDSSLVEALNAYKEKTEEDFNVTLNFIINTRKNEEERMKVSLYRIIQEAITNSIRHGNAKKVNVTIETEDGILRLMIEDDGKGCKSVQEGYGIKGIRERIEQLKGQVILQSKEGNGFNIIAYIPSE